MNEKVRVEYNEDGDEFDLFDGDLLIESFFHESTAEQAAEQYRKTGRTGFENIKI